MSEHWIPTLTAEAGDAAAGALAAALVRTRSVLYPAEAAKLFLDTRAALWAEHARREAAAREAREAGED